jgi:hypothetical protein
VLVDRVEAIFFREDHKMILACHDIFDQLADLDPGSPSVRFLSRKDHPELSASIVGRFSIINEMMVSLYRINGVLYFRIGDQEFELTDNVSSTLETDGNNRDFQLLKSEEVLVDLRYLTRESEIPLSIDPTPFVEEEHFDFLLFVHNVLTQPGRRDRVWNEAQNSLGP